jgi:hypothetical protein
MVDVWVGAKGVVVVYCRPGSFSKDGGRGLLCVSRGGCQVKAVEVFRKSVRAEIGGTSALV